MARACHIRLLEKNAVYVDLALAQLDRLAGQTDDTFDEIAPGITGVMKDNDVAPSRWMESVDDFVDDEVLTFVQRGFRACVTATSLAGWVKASSPGPTTGS
jgi:hypothetical protein